VVIWRRLFALSPEPLEKCETNSGLAAGSSRELGEFPEDTESARTAPPRNDEDAHIEGTGETKEAPLVGLKVSGAPVRLTRRSSVVQMVAALALDGSITNSLSRSVSCSAVHLAR
jgi:hypothetical protein